MNLLQESTNVSDNKTQSKSIDKSALALENKDLEALVKASAMQKASKWLLMGLGVFCLIFVLIINSIDRKFDNLAQKSIEQTKELNGILDDYKEFRKTIYSSLPTSASPNIAEDDFQSQDEENKVSTIIGSLEEEESTSLIRETLMLSTRSEQVVKASAVFVKQRNSQK